LMSENVRALGELQSGEASSSETVEAAAAGDRFAALMEAAQAGKADAYVQLMQQIAPRLRLIVLRYRSVLPAEDIEDLVQDILLSLHAVRATYDPKRPFMPWLLAITRNRLADGARRYARTSLREVNTDYSDVTFANQNANRTEDMFGREDLRNAIDRLPAAQRTAVEMLKLREMS